MPRRPPRSTLFPYTDALPISHHRMVALCNSASRRAPLQRCLLPVRRPADALQVAEPVRGMGQRLLTRGPSPREQEDRKSTRLNSSHVEISYAVFCLKKKKRET